MGGGSSSIGSITKKAISLSTLGLIKEKEIGKLLGESQGNKPTIIQSAPAAAQGGPKAVKPSAQIETAPKPADAAIQAARKKQSRIAAAAGGRAGDIRTTGRGLLTPVRTTKKVLLGQ